MSVSDAETLGRVNFPITFSMLASAGLIALTFLYWYETKSIKETLVFLAAGTAAVGQVTASFYAARLLFANLRKDNRELERAEEIDAREAAREAIRLKRAEEIDAREAAREAIRLKEASLKFGERWNDPSMSDARDTLRMLRRHHSASVEELNRFIDENETKVIHVANFLEEIGTACRYGVVNHEIMKEQFDSVVIGVWKIMFPWIQKQRTQIGPILEDFEALYDAWKAK